ncbi:MAG TPA: 30S ribosomal protein S9 [Patescibacteria group bacterium]|nr:30S ribosomal protein S9 [Patescibacteria group bacterium]
MKEFGATGRRKTAIAQVRLSPGNGKIVVNKRPVEEYFPVDTQRREALFAFEVAKTEGQYDVAITVKGGGKSGQAGAVRLGIARALVETDAELKSLLRPAGLMTRDPRMVERKKYGQKKARKRFQFSKR